MQNSDLVEKNYGLVKKLAFEFSKKSNLEYEDLFQEGVIGLIRASELYDESNGTAFSTYATYWIKQKMQRAIEASLPAGNNAVKNRSKIYKAKREIEEGGVEATPDLIAEKTGFAVEDVMGILGMNMVSIYSRIGENKEDCLLDVIQAEDSSYESKDNHEEQSKVIREAVSVLTEKEKEVIFRRYFSTPGVVCTYDVVSKKMGITKQRVQQVEKKALNKLKYTKPIIEYRRAYNK